LLKGTYRDGVVVKGVCAVKSGKAHVPNMKHPTLKSHAVVSGSIVENSPLGVIMHNSAVGRNLRETGGGGGTQLQPAQERNLRGDQVPGVQRH
jgi:hypothetical protein